jgi:formylglycine-generating enzyme
MTRAISLKVYFFLVAFTCISNRSTAQENISRNSIGMQFILVQPGEMVIGEFNPPYPVPDDTIKNATRPLIMYMGEGRGYNRAEFEQAKKMSEKDSSPGFKVIISKPYYLGRFEVTQGQWKKVMRSNPSFFKQETHSDSLPVENVSWNDAKRFIDALNKLENTNAYRLPTEFEWEYAARAGAKDDIEWKDIQVMANLNKRHTDTIGKNQPNAWGFYDMLGNVWEWVEDFYNEKIFADPKPPKKGKQHVLKGASFVGDVKNATYMTHAAGPGNGWDVGFRIVMEKNKQ